MKDRIKQLMDSQHMNQQTFAKFLDTSPATLSSILSERTRPTLAIVDAIRSKFENINLTWLLYGQGEMFNTYEQEDGANGDMLQGTIQQEPMLPFTAEQGGYPSAQPVRKRASMPMMEFVDDAKKVDKPTRYISEIRVFYDDQTWESFVPKK